MNLNKAGTSKNFFLNPQSAGADVIVLGGVDFDKLTGGADTNPKGHDWLRESGYEPETLGIGVLRQPTS